MHIYDIITKKKRNEALSKDEIRYFVDSFTRGELPDYQISALLMAICLNGMSDGETSELTMAIAESGDTVDLSRFGELSVDKHSTGGVGDKTTLIVAPIVASLGAKVAKMSGRGLGHTGGTIDKLESFPGYSVSLSPKEFISQVEGIGVAVTGQSGNLAPADKKLYALRDVTATVDSIPLITSSVMGKKLASGSRSIVLDVKYGSGSFMKTPAEAEKLAENMVRIGTACGRRVRAIITNMEVPLGKCVGNSLEVIEAIELLSGGGADDLKEVCIALATEMLSLSLGIEPKKARELCLGSIADGSAKNKLREWVKAQGGDASYVDDTEKFAKAPCSLEIRADRSGYITSMDTEKIGLCAVECGAGRATKDDVIDHSAGIVIEKKTGESVNEGELLATLYASSRERLEDAKLTFISAISIGNHKPEASPLIYKTVYEC